MELPLIWNHPGPTKGPSCATHTVNRWPLGLNWIELIRNRWRNLGSSRTLPFLFLLMKVCFFEMELGALLWEQAFFFFFSISLFHVAYQKHNLGFTFSKIVFFTFLMWFQTSTHSFVVGVSLIALMPHQLYLLHHPQGCLTQPLWSLHL